MSDNGLVFPYERHKKRRTGKIRRAFCKDAQSFGRLDAGSRAGFTSSRPPPPWTQVFQFRYFCTMYGLEKLRIVDQTGWSAICAVCY